MTSLAGVFLILLTAALRADAPPLVSGEPIPVGAADRRGPLASGVSNHPLGVARVYGSEQPDLFVPGSGHSSRRGLFLYRWLGTDESGVPIFGQRVDVKYPFKGDLPPAGALYEGRDGHVHAIWLQGKSVVRTSYDVEQREFVLIDNEPTAIRGLPYTPNRIAAIPNPDGSLELLLAMSDNTPQRPAEPSSWRDPAWYGFDGAGVWRGGWPYVSLYTTTLPASANPEPQRARLASATEKEALLSYGNVAWIKLGPGRARDIVTGGRFGNLLYYRNAATGGVDLEKRKLIASPDGIAMRHPTINASPISYPNPMTGLSDLIVGGEGHLYYYRFTGSFTKAGAPIFDLPVSVLEQDAKLYAGSLPVVNVVDWDGDGVSDMVVGNSTGMILFFKNAGTSRAPAFLPGVPLEAGGRIIHVQPGYWGIQGPQEARWGYASPTVFDWNGDDLPDILLSDSTARHTVFINRGTRTDPKLDHGQLLYCDGLEVHGTWRVKPAAAKMGDKIAYVALDDQDEFHLYHRIDDYNLERIGKLTLEDGSPIRANFLAAGGTGRAKINLVDWDGDGKIDLLVGTPRHGSIPDPKKGLPQSRGLKGAAVVFLKNVGTNDQPVFAFPTMIKFKGEPIYLGQHECGPAVADFGDAGGPNLVVGSEIGRIMYYKRSDLTWDPD